MCIGGGSRTQTVVQPSPPAPVRRPNGTNVARLYRNRQRSARGVFGNIFTSPLGTAGNRASTSATKLGDTTQPAVL